MPDEVKEQVVRLEKEEAVLATSVMTLEKSCNDLNSRLKNATEKLDLTNAELDGKDILYVLSIQLKESSFSLDIGKHMKNSMNAITFTLPVSEDMYNSVNVGEPLVDDFRAGSFVMNGSFGSWKMSVTKKEIIVK